MLKDGLSLIPVRDKQEGEKLPKTPCQRSWTPYQTEIIDKGFLFHEMEKYDTTAVAIVCGPVSGNLEVIDIDSKYKEGISAELFSKIKDILPELYKRVRVHKTPSGGYHILYRIENPPEEFPGNLKLAGRSATDEELKERPKNKVYNFLETRGNKGYVLAPPSLDYSVRFDRPIPVITWAERCDLISICKSFHEVIEYKPQVKPKKSEQNYYDLTPWEDFNARGDVDNVLKNAGWAPVSQKGDKYLYFTRPGKSKGVSASLNLETRILWSYTVSTELEENKGYKPVDLLLILQFNGNTKDCYRYLTSNGYGQVKHKVEQSIIKKNALAGKDIPKNFTSEAKQMFESLKIEITESNPYGIFWNIEADSHGNDKVLISRQSLYEVSNGLGFRLHNGGIVRIVDKFIHDVQQRDWMDTLKDYITEEDAELYEDIVNAFEAFMQRSGDFTLKRLEILDTSNILTDTRETCNKFFLNGYLTIEAKSSQFNTYDALDKLVFYSRVQQRDFIKGSGGLYVDFLNKSIGIDDYLKSILGFYAHEYKDEATGFFVVCTEKVENPEDGGGAGKNIFCNLIKHTTSYMGRAASQTKTEKDEKLLQAWNGQRVLGISDTPEGFDFSFFKELVTGEGIQKKLYKDDRTVDVREMPKFIGQTNYSVVCTDGGMKRRMRILEFTDFFTMERGVNVHYNGKLFPTDWNQEDWAGYDNMIIESVQLYLSQGRTINQKDLSDGGWLKRFKQQFRHVASDFIITHYDEIVKDLQITNADFKTMMLEYFIDKDIPALKRPSYDNISKALDEYAEHKGMEVMKDKTIRLNPMQTVKGRRFVQIDPPF